jgi:hypothetical protein
MPTGKYKKKNKETNDIGSRGAVHNVLVSMANDNDKDEQHIPWSLLITVLVLCIVLVIVLPVMGIMYMDLNNAMYQAAQETRKMKELRLQVIKELKGE